MSYSLLTLCLTRLTRLTQFLKNFKPDTCPDTRRAPQCPRPLRCEPTEKRKKETVKASSFHNKQYIFL